MARFVFTKGNMPTSEEFRVMLEQAPPRSSAEYLHDLSQDLVVFENQFNMSSDVFYARFMRGEMGDDMPYIEWAGCYELYLETKRDIDVEMAQVPVLA